APLRLLGAPLRWLRRPPPAPATSGEPELYFHPLSYAELRATRPFRGVRLAVWRSVDVPFTRAYAHGRLGGRHLLRAVFALEERFPRACGRLGAYPIFLLEGAPGPDAGEA
ncbi:MAG: hypothetical protein KIT58_17045, partial [Planctomycetota bacterium]|nr:hypothetical protein [Planctomycetota bacterium]